VPAVSTRGDIAAAPLQWPAVPSYRRRPAAGSPRL